MDEKSAKRSYPLGRVVASASTWFPTHAQLWNSLLSVAGKSDNSRLKGQLPAIDRYEKLDVTVLR
jgi:hypothetical protein